jgi:hypothetical protein
MRRWLAPLFLAFVVGSFAHARAGWPAALFGGLSTGVLSMYVGTLVRGRAMKKAPEAPALLSGEKPLLHGPVEVIAEGGQRTCWAYLSDQRLSLLPLDGSEGQVLALKALKDLRPAKPRYFGLAYGPIGLVFEGQLWQIKVPDVERWTSALRQGAH